LFVTFTNSVSCQSIQGSLRVSDAVTGVNVPIDSIIPFEGCNADNQDSTFKVSIRGFVPGRTYKLINSGQILDICGNTVISDSIFFTYLGEQFVPAISNSGGVLRSNIRSGVTFQWFRNGVLIQGSTTDTLTISQTGTYYLEVRNSSGCVAQSNQIIITSFYHFEESHSFVYPNPSKGVFSVSVKGGQDLTTIKVFDSYGRRIISEEVLPGVETHEFTIKKKGIYILEANSKNGISHIRLLVE